MKFQFSQSQTPATLKVMPLTQMPDRAESLSASGALPGAKLVYRAAQSDKFDASTGRIFECYVEDKEQLSRIALLGVGEPTKLNAQKAGGAMISKYLRGGLEQLEIDFSAFTGDAKAAANLLFGARLRSWNIDKYRTKLAKKKQVSLNLIEISNAPDGLEDLWSEYEAIASGVDLTRELVSEPANIIYPESFVERCADLADLGVKITVLDDDKMRELGMGALLGVAQGSVKPARLLVMEWDGTGGSTAKPLVLVGKGVTFDTGGISIKPASGMEDMKWDMGGAGAVAGTMKALAARKAKAHIVGICGLVENMPDGNAQRPGDVVTSMSGQTIEVINTDAEGRLVLCDALHWAQQNYKPEYIIDLATLTGAIIISLGHEHAGIFTNDDDLSDKLVASGKSSGDPLWRFPLSAAYDKLLDSPIADMKNVGPRGAGSITAAQFLKRFIHDGVKWAHIDIAGMVWADKEGPIWDKGATGFGVRLLNQLVADHFEQK